MVDQRLEYAQLAPAAFKALGGLEAYLYTCGLDHKLLHMLKLRASQINGCAFCIDMHWKDARAAGETEQRLYGLAAWEEANYYSDKERAALAWVEAVTRVAETHAPDEVFEALRAHFSEKEIVDLTWLAAAINAWNRMAIAMRAKAGDYQPGMYK